MVAPEAEQVPLLPLTLDGIFIAVYHAKARSRYTARYTIFSPGFSLFFFILALLFLVFNLRSSFFARLFLYSGLVDLRLFYLGLFCLGLFYIGLFYIVILYIGVSYFRLSSIPEPLTADSSFFWTLLPPYLPSRTVFFI